MAKTVVIDELIVRQIATTLFNLRQVALHAADLNRGSYSKGSLRSIDALITGLDEAVASRESIYDATPLIVKLLRFADE